MARTQKPRTLCIVCNTRTKRSGYTYCSNTCQMEYQYRQYIARWKAGKETGFLKLGVVSRHVKRYLREKYADQCCLCGWSQVNPVTKKVPLVADHIDGNWQNNTEENLRLVCPNCDALSPTFAALNKGNGRKHRSPSKRYQRARNL